MTTAYILMGLSLVMFGFVLGVSVCTVLNRRNLGIGTKRKPEDQNWYE